MQSYLDGFEFRQVAVRHDQLPELRHACSKNGVVLVEDVKPADADAAKLKRRGTMLVALNGQRLRVAAVRRELRV